MRQFERSSRSGQRLASSARHVLAASSASVDTTPRKRAHLGSGTRDRNSVIEVARKPWLNSSSPSARSPSHCRPDDDLRDCTSTPSVATRHARAATPEVVLGLSVAPRAPCQCEKCSRMMCEIRKSNPCFEVIEDVFHSNCCKLWLNYDAELPLRLHHKAAQAGALDVVMRCLLAGVPVDDASSIGRTALHYACSNNHVAVVDCLLKFRADVNRITLGGMTPLHVACQSRAEDCVLALLSQKDQFVMVELEDDHRKTPMMLARRSEFATFLISEYKDSMGKLNMLSANAKFYGPNVQVTLQERLRSKALRIMRESKWRRRWFLDVIYWKLRPMLPRNVWQHVVISFLGLS
eukprot:TRINITY_DN36959_c0_g1_i1.p1 TRINITY_DN36959_c0_g1~~TRINITY_DN36959_c0_g1_i1.p1  ORF type:complete len:350 (+),score=51.94 TRINITY_DN36959_c0_g1_i1:102-1151(+)